MTIDRFYTTNQRIAETERRISVQRENLERQMELGLDSEQSRRLLLLMQDTLDIMKQRRRYLVGVLADAPLLESRKTTA